MPHLPNEIWHAVFQCFQASLPEDDWKGEVSSHAEYRKTLRSLSLVCRRFHSLAQGLMYRTVPLRVQHHPLLARTLAAQPRLGLAARRTSLVECELPGDDEGDLALARSMEAALQALDVAPAVKERLQKGLPFPPYGPNPWPNRLCLPAFLLAMMPRVRLVECGNVARSHPVLPWMLGGGFGETQDGGARETHANFLPDLVELRLRGSKARMKPMTISDVESVLLHPNLKTLHLACIDWTADDVMREMQWPNQPCNLEHLFLRRAVVDVPAVRNILTRCENLQTLSISLRAVMSRRLDLRELCSTVIELGQNLVRFELDTWDFESLSRCDGTIICFGELFSLTRLRHVDIKILQLRGWRLKRSVPASTGETHCWHGLTLQK